MRGQLSLSLQPPRSVVPEVGHVANPPVTGALAEAGATGTAEAVERRLIEHLSARWQPDPVELVWTRNRSTFLSMSRRGGTVRVRLHRCFAGAPEPVVDHLLRFLTTPGRSAPSRQSLTHLRLYFENNHREGNASRRADDVAGGIVGSDAASRGSHFDLESEWQSVRREWLLRLEGEISCRWGRWPVRPARGRRRQHSLQLGSFCQVARCIRIHPVLDHEQTPPWFLRFVLFHEGLHALYPPELGGSARRVVHSARFRAAERRHADAERSERWLQKNLTSLLRRAAQGPPV